MAPKLTKQDQKTLENLFTFLLLIPVFIFWFLKALVMGIAFVCRKFSVIKAKRIVNGQRFNLDDVDCMDGSEFEYYVAELLRNNGYAKVSVTKLSGDFGVDIIAFKDNKKWAFQCKNYNSKLGVSPIQEIYSGAAKYHAQIAVVVTNSFFTEHAKELAQDLKVLLWDRVKLAKLIKSDVN